MAQYDAGGQRKAQPVQRPRTAAPSAPRSSAPATTQPVAAAPPPTTAAGAGWQADPILQQINGYYGPGGPFLTGAQGTYTQGVHDLLVNYGYDPSLDSLFPDQATKDAAKNNPFSVLANLQHGHELRTTNLNEGLNKQNLFYSGYRGKQLGEEGRTYLGEQYGSSQTLRGGISGLSQNLTNAGLTAGGKIIDASQTAETNWLNSGLANPPPVTSPTSVSGALRAAVPSTASGRASQRTALLRRNIR